MLQNSIAYFQELRLSFVRFDASVLLRSASAEAELMISIVPGSML
jgi:hypothetical protein